MCLSWRSSATCCKMVVTSSSRPPENPEWSDRLFGSDDMHLMRKCPCPVWMIKPQAEKSYRRILAAVDAGDDYPPAELATRHVLNLQILEMASSLALSEFAELHVAHAWVAIGERLMRGGFAKKARGGGSCLRRGGSIATCGWL